MLNCIIIINIIINNNNNSNNNNIIIHDKQFLLLVYKIKIKNHELLVSVIAMFYFTLL